MKHHAYPIPARLNLLITLTQLAGLLTILWASGRAQSGCTLVLLALAYGVVMNSAYAMQHEAEHNLAHPNRVVNEGIGIVLALFFPAPFHLLRQGHLGHHMRNRSDDEAFDFYFEGENPIWKHLQLYGILTGLFWIVIFLGNILALFNPSMLRPKYAAFDRPTEAFMESLNPKYRWLIQFEAFLIFVLHGGLIFWWHIPTLHYCAVLFGFGAMWSAFQYVHHFGTVRDVCKGARNLRTFVLLDLVWLNHNWHLNHHLEPTVPWIYLPSLRNEHDFSRGGLLAAYLRMWRGPRLTHERVKNRYAGKIIR